MEDNVTIEEQALKQSLIRAFALSMWGILWAVSPHPVASTES